MIQPNSISRTAELLRRARAFPGAPATPIRDAFKAASPDTAYALAHAILSGDPTLIAPLARAAVPELQAALSARDRNASTQELLTFAQAAANGARARLAKLGSTVPRLSLRFRVEPKDPARPWRGKLHVDFSTPPLDHPGSHDAHPFETADIAELQLAVLTTPGFEAITCEVIANALRPTPLFKYHPERTRASRPHIRHVPEIPLRDAKPVLTEADMRAVMDQLIAENRRRHLEFTIVERDRFGEEPSQALYAEMYLELAYFNFRSAGRQIFDFPPELVRMMSISDADDIRLEQIRTPYAAQFVHFGPLGDLPLAPGWHCDGAYVLASDGALTVRLTAAPANSDEILLWPLRSEPSYDFHFPRSDAGLDLGTAIDTSVARSLAHLRGDLDYAAQQQAIADANAIESGDDPLSVSGITERRVASQSAQLLTRKEVAHRALALVVNALCYITAYPDDIAAEWPESAPRALSSRADAGTPKERKRALQELTALGYSRVHICGRQFRVAHTGAPALHGGTVRPHWRRGHWRQQPHGEGRRLRKLVWILPILVHAEATDIASGETRGHIYRPEEHAADQTQTDTL